MTVVSIRGTHGSGKSTIVAKILAKYPNTPLITTKKRPDGYYVDLGHIGRPDKLYIVGPYLTACGGCDAIQPYDDILTQILKAHKNGCHVLFEGALVSSSYGRVGELMETLSDPVFAFLDTPLEVCLERIAQRRATKWAEANKAGQPPPVNPDNTAHKHDSVSRTKDQLERLCSGIRVVDISYKKPVTQIMKLFGVTLRKEP